jgi:hypothetical protein
MGMKSLIGLPNTVHIVRERALFQGQVYFCIEVWHVVTVRIQAAIRACVVGNEPFYADFCPAI